MLTQVRDSHGALVSALNKCGCNRDLIDDVVTVPKYAVKARLSVSAAGSWVAVVSVSSARHRPSAMLHSNWYISV